MIPEQVAAELAARLAAVLPPELHVSVAGSVISLGSGLGSSQHDLSWAVGEFGALASAVEAFLDQLQTDVAEATTEPWPATAPDPMPDSFARIEGDALVAGYENALTLEPIPLDRH